MKTLSTGVITGGIAIGNAFVYKASQKEADTYIPKSIEEENQILQTALAGVKNELSVLAESDEIFAAHYEMADDPMIEEQAASLIEEGLGAYDAVLQTSDALCAMFDEIDAKIRAMSEQIDLGDDEFDLDDDGDDGDDFDIRTLGGDDDN